MTKEINNNSKKQVIVGSFDDIIKASVSGNPKPKPKKKKQKGNQKGIKL